MAGQATVNTNDQNTRALEENRSELFIDFRVTIWHMNNLKKETFS